MDIIEVWRSLCCCHWKLSLLHVCVTVSLMSTVSPPIRGQVQSNTSPRLASRLVVARDRTTRRIGYYCSRVPAVPVPAQSVYLYRHLYLSALLSCAGLRVARTGFFTGWLSRLSPGAGLSRTLERPDPARRDETRRGLGPALNRHLTAINWQGTDVLTPSKGVEEGSKNTIELFKLNDTFHVVMLLSMLFKSSSSRLTMTAWV